MAYYRKWQINVNEYISAANSQIQRALVDAHNRNPKRSDNLPHIMEDLQSSVVSAGKLPAVPPIPAVPPAIIMRRQPQISNSSTADQIAESSGHSGQKRKADQLSVIYESEVSGDIYQTIIRDAQRKRAPKKCWKCEANDCLGATGKQKCTSPCKSCGLYECAGKDSRYPKKLCPTLLNAEVQE